MCNTSFIKKLLLVATLVLLYSCDKDFNAIGNDLVGDNHFGLEPEYYDVTAYNQKVTPAASNNLAINPLGILDSPVFGNTTANFNTQVVMATYAPEISAEATIDSVTLNIPYFVVTNKTTINSNGSITYVLDSIYGPSGSKLKLSVYESGYTMRGTDPNPNPPTQTNQLYYTDQNSLFENAIPSTSIRLNDSIITISPGVNDYSENDAFFFNNKEIVETVKDTVNDTETKVRIAPQMRLHLNKKFFQERFLNPANASNLANVDVFKNYFKGLFFKVERSGTNPTNMAMIDFSKGSITIFYKDKSAITTDAEDIKENKTLVLNLTGTTSPVYSASLQQVESNGKPDYAAYINATKNDSIADDVLYLKGGEGSMAIIKLTGFEEQLAEIKTKDWLVNEANLIFNIDTQKIKDIADEPLRVYLYNATDNTVIADYVVDGTSNLSDPKKSKYIYDGIINVDASTKRGTNYKIRLTSYIRNLIKNEDAEKNVKLGLVVTENIGDITSNLLDLKSINPNSIKEIPRASVLSQLGTVLFGGTAKSAEKRVRLEVYYTKPN